MTIVKTHFLQPLRGKDRLGRASRAILNVRRNAVRRGLECRDENLPSPHSYLPGSGCWPRRHSKALPVAVTESTREN